MNYLYRITDSNIERYLKVVLYWCTTDNDPMSTWYLEQTFGSLGSRIFYKVPLNYKTTEITCPDVLVSNGGCSYTNTTGDNLAK